MAAQDFMPRDDVIAGIRRDIEQYEIERARTWRQVLWRVPVFLGAVLAVALLLAIAFNSFASPYEQWLSPPHVFLYIGTVVVAFWLYRAVMRPARLLRQSFHNRVLPIIFAFVQDLRCRTGVTPNSIGRLPKAAIGNYNRRTYDDVISGKYEGFPFELFEARYSNKTRKSDATVFSSRSETTVFKGVVLAFESVAPFPGLLVAIKRAGAVTRFFRDTFGADGLEEVTSGQADLDGTYEFRTDNPAAAQPLVSGRLAKLLRWLNETWPQQPPRVALQGGDGFLLLPVAKNFFELPGISQPIDYHAHVEPLVAELVSLLATAALVRQVGAPDEEPAQSAKPDDPA
jgi:hypothetical protein